MKQTRILMGMPITVEIIGGNVTIKQIRDVFDYFKRIDRIFSTYKKESEISKINRNEIKKKDYSRDVREVFRLSEKTKQETNGYFDIWRHGSLDPSGLVKGWAVRNASKILRKKGFNNFYIDAGGDIQVEGYNKTNKKWRVGVKNPFKQDQIVKVVCLTNQGIATSGTYIRGQHVYDPIAGKEQKDIVSLTVIGPNVYEADRFATAAFAMGRKGIEFISIQPGLEGYMIDRDGVATFTKGFEQFIC